MAVKKRQSPPQFVGLLCFPHGKTHPLLKELHGESDRGAAIVASTMLDQTLEVVLLRTVFRAPDGDTHRAKTAGRLFTDQNGPVQSSYAKIETAYVCGVITKQERDNLHAVREIRNAFAHHNGLSFTDPDVEAAVRKIIKPYRDRGGAVIREAIRAAEARGDEKAVQELLAWVAEIEDNVKK